MPTASQYKILHKIGAVAGGRNTSAREQGLQRAAEEAKASSSVYIPPPTRIINLGKRGIDLARLQALENARDGQARCFFPEMVSCAVLMSRPGSDGSDMSADEIMKRLHELGWRKEGQGQRLRDEERRREDERLRVEEEHAARRRQCLDLVNDPVLKRVKEKTVNVPKYVRAPDSRPFSVCFDYMGPSVAHSTVKMKLDQLIYDLDDTDDVKIVSLEYQPRAMHIKGQNVGNRWVINLDSQYGVARLHDVKMSFGKQEVQLMRYDDVIGTEFSTFTRQSNFMKSFNME